MDLGSLARVSAETYYTCEATSQGYLVSFGGNGAGQDEASDNGYLTFSKWEWVLKLYIGRDSTEEEWWIYD